MSGVEWGESKGVPFARRSTIAKTAGERAAHRRRWEFSPISGFYGEHDVITTCRTQQGGVRGPPCRSSRPFPSKILLLVTKSMRNEAGLVCVTTPRDVYACGVLRGRHLVASLSELALEHQRGNKTTPRKFCTRACRRQSSPWRPSRGLRSS